MAPRLDRGETAWTWREASGAWQLWALVATFFLCCVSHSTLMLHMVPHVTDHHVAPGTAAAALGLAGVFVVAGRIGVGAIADAIGGKRALVIALAAQTVMAPWLLATTEVWALTVFAVIFGVGYGGVFPAYPVLSREYFGDSRLGAIFGLQLAGSMAGMALGGYLGGALHDATGTYTTAFLASLAAGAASIGLAACLRRPDALRDWGPGAPAPALAARRCPPPVEPGAACGIHAEPTWHARREAYIAKHGASSPASGR